MKGSQFTDLNSGIVLDEITGALGLQPRWSRSGGSAQRLQGFPVALDISSDWDADEVFRARVNGMLPVEKVIPDELHELEPLFARASGNSRWDVNISVASVEGSEDKEIWLNIYSGLEGVSSIYPLRCKNLPIPAGPSWCVTQSAPSIMW